MRLRDYPEPAPGAVEVARPDWQAVTGLRHDSTPEECAHFLTTLARQDEFDLDRLHHEPVLFPGRAGTWSLIVFVDPEMRELPC